MKFLGNVIATVIGIFVFIMLFFFGVIFIGVVFGGDDKVSVKSDSVIEFNLKEIKNDYAGKYKDPWVSVFSDKKGIGLTDVINAIEAAKTDDNIKGISILNDESSLGLAQYKDLRNALESFKKSGKFVWAYANTYSQKEYYLTSVANTIYINPAGDLDFKGLSSEVMFFKDFQDKSGIHMEVIRHGKYKSA
ncbi:S49 family peptidase, partial [Flavobacterium sp. UBA4854]